MAKLHRDNAGYIGCSHEETQDPYYSYNKLSLPLSGATETVQRPAEVTHTVTVAGGKFVIGGVSQATLSLLEGGVYKFDQSDSSNGSHPFKFSQTSNGTWNSGTEYTKGVSYVGTPGSSGAYTQLVVPFGGLDLYYYCGNHTGMGGSATTPANAGMFTAALPILKTTDQFGKTLGSGVADDPFAANLVLAVPMNGSNNGTAFTDVSDTIRGSGTAKVVGISGDTKTVTTTSNYYGSSAFFDGSGDYLSVSNSSDFDFGSNDFTVECWVYLNSISGDQYIINWGGESGNPFHQGINVYNGNWRIGGFNDYLIGGSTGLVANKWFHIAMTRKNGRLSAFVDGSVIGSISAPATFNCNSSIIIGGHYTPSLYLNGYIQDLRIYNGVAKYQPEGSGSLGMDVVTYSGNSTARNIGGLAFAPDLVIVKSRSNAGYNHYWVDSVRGTNKNLYSNSTEATQTADRLSSFNSDGFGLTNHDGVNSSGKTYVAWAWKAGGAATTIAAGSSNSSVYDQSQTWSNAPFFAATNGSANTATPDKAFDASTAYGNSNGVLPAAAGESFDWDFSSVFSNAKTVTIKTEAGGSDSNKLKVNGNDVVVPNGNGSVTVDVTGTGFNSLQQNRSASSYCYIFDITVDGALLVNSGVTPPNVPSIASSVSASTDYGFSIVKWTATNGSATIGHGLTGSTPAFILVKDTASSTFWQVYHSSLGNTKAINLNSTNAASAAANHWNNTSPTSTTFSVGVNSNYLTDNHIAYVWSEVAGYSKISSYTGSGAAGNVQNLGFKPRWVMIKCSTSSTDEWVIFDSARPLDKYLYANNSSAEASYSNRKIEISDTGFSFTGSDQAINTSGQTHIYMAFAESAPGDPGQDAFKILDTLNTKDQSSSAHTVTNNGASFQTSVQKFYDGAAAFSGGSSVVVPSNSDLQFGTGDFTIEGWMHPTSYGVTYPSVISKYDNSDASWIIRLHSSGQLVWYSGNTNNNTSTSGLSLLNSWNHVSAIRNSGVVTMYLNGYQVLSVADTHDYNDSNSIYFGRQDASNVNGLEGYLQDWRIYNGIAKYTSSFSPPERSIQGTARRYPSGVYVVS